MVKGRLYHWRDGRGGDVIGHITGRHWHTDRIYRELCFMKMVKSEYNYDNVPYFIRRPFVSHC